MYTTNFYVFRKWFCFEDTLINYYPSRLNKLLYTFRFLHHITDYIVSRNMSVYHPVTIAIKLIAISVCQNNTGYIINFWLYIFLHNLYFIYKFF